MTTDPGEPSSQRAQPEKPSFVARYGLVTALFAVAVALTALVTVLVVRRPVPEASVPRNTAESASSPRPARLDLEVVDGEGHAVPEARLELLGERHHATSTSDAAGHASLTGLPGTVIVQVEAEGFARAVSQVDLSADAPTSLRIALEPERVLEGSIEDDQHRPLVGAHIRIDSIDAPDMTPWETQSDDAGKFRVSGLPRHSLEVEASHPGHETVERTLLAQDPTQLGFVLPRQGELMVLLRDASGQPVVGGVVLLSGPGLWPAAEGRTNAEGAHLFQGLAAGPYRARGVKDADVGLPTESIAVVPGARAEAELTLTAGARVCGTLVDATSKTPVSGAKVSIQDLTPGLPPRSVTSDAEGRFDAVGLWPGPARIEVLDARYAPTSLERTLPLGGCETVALEGAAVVSGVVVDEQGRPVPQALISVSTRAGLPVVLDAPKLGSGLSSIGELGVTKGPVPRIPVTASSSFALGALAAETDANGAFRVAGLNPEPIVLSAARAGFAPAMVELSGLAPHAEKSDLRIVLPHAGRIEGRISDARGEPVPGVYVAARSRDGLEQSAVTNDRGEFVVPDVLGPVTVEATPSGYATMTCNVTVRGGSVERCELGAESALYELAVRVVDERGFGLEGALVTLRARGIQHPRSQISRADGTLALRELPDPPYTVDVALRGYLPVQQRVSESERELRIPLAQAAVIRGVVLDAIGRPVRGAFVSTDEGESTADTDLSGTFELDGVAPGVLYVWARHPRAGEGTSREVRARAGDMLEAVRIVLNGRYQPSAEDERARADRENRAPATPRDQAEPTATASSTAPAARASSAADFALEQRGASVIVTDVAAGGVASRSGMRAGDVVLSVDREPVYGVAQARGMLRDPADTMASVRVSRDGRTLSLRWKRPPLGTKLTSR